MQTEVKKVFYVKMRSLARTLKEYQNYEQQVSGYDMNEVSQNKKKLEFYEQSKSALESVSKNLLEFHSALNAFIDEYKPQIEEDASVKDDYEKAQHNLLLIKQMFPAAC